MAAILIFTARGLTFKGEGCAWTSVSCTLVSSHGFREQRWLSPWLPSDTLRPCRMQERPPLPLYHSGIYGRQRKVVPHNKAVLSALLYPGWVLLQCELSRLLSTYFTVVAFRCWYIDTDTSRNWKYREHLRYPIGNSAVMSVQSPTKHWTYNYHNSQAGTGAFQPLFLLGDCQLAQFISTVPLLTPGSCYLALRFQLY